MVIETGAVWMGRNIRLPGVGRLLRLIYPQGPKSHRWISGVRRRADGMLMDLDTRQLIDWEILFRGGYESHLVPVFESILTSGGTAADVGANVGVHTLTMARIVGEDGRVFAYEPNPAVHSKLVKNVELNGLGQVTVRNHALGDDFGAVQLRVPRSDTMEAGNPGLASVLALGTPHDEVEVAVEPLDSLLFRENLNRLDMIKIDVQGYESFVFRGGREIIENLKPALVFEYEDWAWKASGGSFAEVLSMLKAADYVLWPLTTALGEKKIVAYDFLQSVPHIEILALPRDGDRTAGVCAALNLQSSK